MSEFRFFISYWILILDFETRKRHYNYMIFDTVFYIEFSTEALTDIMQSKIDETPSDPWRSDLMRSLNFLTLNFIPQENKRDMEMQKQIHITSWTSNSVFRFWVRYMRAY